MANIVEILNRKFPWYANVTFCVGTTLNTLNQGKALLGVFSTESYKANETSLFIYIFLKIFCGQFEVGMNLHSTHLKLDKLAWWKCHSCKDWISTPRLLPWRHVLLKFAIGDTWARPPRLSILSLSFSNLRDYVECSGRGAGLTSFHVSVLSAPRCSRCSRVCDN